MIGATLGGLAGLLFASKQQYVEPNAFMVQLSFLFVAMVVIGGSGNVYGAILGAFLLTYLPEGSASSSTGGLWPSVRRWDW